MRRWLLCALLWTPGTLLGAQSSHAPDGLLDRIKAKMRENLTRAPDYICRQTIERWGRRGPDEPMQQLDTLRLEVGFAGDKEIFAWQGSSRFEEKELSEMIGAGTVGTGSFAIHAANVFLSSAPVFTYKDEATLEGRRAIRYDFEVAQEFSKYKVRVPPYQAIVAFHGSFWVDAENLDLIRLAVNADDIPEELRLARVSDVMDYARVRIGRSEYLLPKSSEFTMLGVHGHENRNRRELRDCRQYVGESDLSFAPPAEGAPPPKTEAARPELPPNLAMELSLDSEIDIDTAAIGDPVRAVLARPLTHRGRELAPEGTVVEGRLVRLEKYSTPIEYYVVGLQFHTLKLDDADLEFSATMETADSVSGLIRQSKRMDPTFSRRRSPRMEVLAAGHQRGQGVLHWKAKQRRIPRGLRMRWRTDAAP